MVEPCGPDWKSQGNLTEGLNLESNPEPQSNTSSSKALDHQQDFKTTGFRFLELKSPKTSLSDLQSPLKALWIAKYNYKTLWSPRKTYRLYYYYYYNYYYYYYYYQTDKPVQTPKTLQIAAS